MNLIGRAAHRLHIDGATFFSIVNKTWVGLAGVITILLIARVLSPIEQGYYFTFSSLLALQIVIELGFSYVITQVAAHEYALSHQLEVLSMRERARSRLISLFRLSLAWYGVISVIFGILCSLAGELFFRRLSTNDPSVWQGPWLFAVVAFALSLNLIPLYAFLEGCNRVSTVAKVRTFQDVVGYSALWGMFLVGHGLYAIPALYVGRIIGGLSGLFLMHQIPYLLESASGKVVAGSKISWKKEIFPFQWKIALSWLSGYLIFQLISPVLFANQGAKAAGQAGMTIAIFTGFSALMTSWVSTRAPYFCQLIATQRTEELKQLFKKVVVMSTSILLLGLTMLVGGMIIARVFLPSISERILGNASLFCLAFASIANHIITSFAIYLRAHKEEPFLTLSIGAGVLTALSVLLFSYISTFAAIVGYSSVVVFISLPWASMIFLNKLRNRAVLQILDTNVI